MDKNFKLVLIIAGSIFIGLSAYAALERYIVFKQIESITTHMTKNLQKSSEQSRKRMLASQQEQQKRQALQAQEQQRRQQAQVAEANRIKALNKQLELEKNLLCAKSIDTGRCSCYDKRSGTPVNMSLEQCSQYVDKQFSSY